MIFPGMDPYLENPLVWHGFHQRAIVYLADILQPLLQPRYIAAVEARVVIQGPGDPDRFPDVSIRPRVRPVQAASPAAVQEAARPHKIRVTDLEVHENYVEILDSESGLAVIATIELVSPSNKYAGPGRVSYLTKQDLVRKSTVHLIEVDLLRTGPSVVAVPEYFARSVGDYDYLVSVNRAVDLRDEFEVYTIALRERLPAIAIPLAAGDTDVQLDLQAVIERTYTAGLYEDRLRYDLPCRPALAAEDQAWADDLIRASLAK